MSEVNERSILIGQIFRFVLTGGFLTVSVAAGYWAVTEFLHVAPMTSMTLVYLTFTGIGYLLHSRFSFRGYGARDRAPVRTARFFTVNTIGFVANQFFVWFLTSFLGGPSWWPVIPVCLVTPILTFSLNRRWVFG
ncbi:GtrA family protein [Aquisediminimonas profunda]|uniref:GtrA family protein n=1 Tax=Aquisediminimonas profunda TaxID=1550733 RepID=UPI001C6250C5|nr:GtrA family protein [Aquisediminimonas profunda]